MEFYSLDSDCQSQRYLGFDEIGNHFYDRDDSDLIYCATMSDWIDYWKMHGDLEPRKKFIHLFDRENLVITDHFSDNECPYRTRSSWI
jgi:hypothetical protein